MGFSEYSLYRIMIDGESWVLGFSITVPIDSNQFVTLCISRYIQMHNCTTVPATLELHKYTHRQAKPCHVLGSMSLSLHDG